MATKQEMFNAQDFEDILKQEKEMYESKTKDLAQIEKAAPQRVQASTAKNRWAQIREHSRNKKRVKAKLESFFRRKNYQRRKSEQLSHTETSKSESQLSQTETQTESAMSASNSAVPSRLRRLSHRREMEEFVLPPRDKSESYIGMYT